MNIDFLYVPISLIALFILIRLLKYGKNSDNFIKAVRTQTFLLLFLIIILIINIINFERTTSSIMKLILISSVIIFGVSSLIKKLKKH